MKMREELASTTYPKWFGMIEKKLEENDPEGTGYCANGKLSIADLIVRASKRDVQCLGFALVLIGPVKTHAHIRFHKSCLPTPQCDAAGVQHLHVDRERRARRHPDHHLGPVPQGAPCL